LPTTPTTDSDCWRAASVADAAVAARGFREFALDREHFLGTVEDLVDPSLVWRPRGQISVVLSASSA
jgi:hypothetical protein